MISIFKFAGKCRFFLVGGVLFFFSFNAWAKKHIGFPSTIKINQLYVEYWTIEDGLTSNNLTSVYQTRDGFLWFTSFNGLNRSDGHDFDLFNKENTPDLLTNSFYRLYEDASGQLYAATQGSYVLKYDEGGFVRFKGLNTLPKSNRVIVHDNDGTFWAGTNNNGLFFKEDSLFKKFHHPVLENISVYDILIQGSNKWVATFGNGLVRIDGNNNVTVFTEKDGLPSHVVTSLAMSKEGVVLVGTSDGLCKIVGGQVKKVESTSGQNINQIVSDDYNNIWMATESGLTRINESHHIYERLTEENGLPSRQISGLHFDHESSLWLSTKKSGIVRLKLGNVETLALTEGIKSTNINVISEYDGKIYIGTDEGDIQYWSEGKVSDFKILTNIYNAGIRDIYKDQDGTFWIASYSGLLEKKGEKEHLYNEEDGLGTKEIRRIYPYKKELWLASRSGGVIRFNTNTKAAKVYNTSNVLPSDYVLSIEQAPNGSLYFGTFGGGLAIKTEDNQWQTFVASNDASGFIIFNIHFDHNGNCWLATNVGVYLFKEGQFFKVSFGKNHHLETVFDIIEDKQDHFWLTTNRGIAQIKKSYFYSFAKDHSTVFKIVKLYDDSDGMMNRECTGATRSLLSSSGNIWVPTLGGVVIVRPDKIQFNTKKPQVTIKSLNIDGEDFNIHTPIQVPPGKNRYEFHFTALSFYAPDKINFKYRLAGFDQEWIEVLDDREAIYTNLSPGSYTFEVMGSNNDGLWNDEISALTFFVKPHYYETWFFRIGMLLLIVLTLYLLYKKRVRNIALRNMKLKKVNEELDRFVYSASHDLRAPLASVQGLVKIAQKESSSTLKDEYLSMIASSIQKLDGFTKEITDFSRNARSEIELSEIKFEEVIEETFSDLQYLEKGKSIERRISIHAEVPFISDRRRLRMIFHNLISNAINYHNLSHQNPFIEVKVNVRKEGANIQIIDNGIGISRVHLGKIFNMFYRASEGSQGSGLGLYIVKETVLKLKGKVSVKSEENEGTTFTIVLPTLKMKKEKKSFPI